MDDREAAKLIADLKSLQDQADALSKAQEELRAMLRATILKSKKLIEEIDERGEQPKTGQ